MSDLATSLERTPDRSAAVWAPCVFEGSRVGSSRAKRILDVVGALTAIVLFLPLLLTIALVVKLESGGPIIFRQRRTGHRGRVFTILKFRTMTVSEDTADLRQATRGDSRITTVGAVLRKLSLDELPQILNVLRGDMSLVGPRPHALVHDEKYATEVPNYAARFRAKPGLTGLAQVSGLRGAIQNLDAIDARVDADNAYIDNWSIWLDLKIIARTGLVIFRDPAAY